MVLGRTDISGLDWFGVTIVGRGIVKVCLGVGRTFTLGLARRPLFENTSLGASRRWLGAAWEVDEERQPTVTLYIHRKFNLPFGAPRVSLELYFRDVRFSPTSWVWWKVSSVSWANLTAGILEMGKENEVGG